MIYNLYSVIIAVFSSIALSGCLSTQQAIPISLDTYLIRVEDHGGIFAFNRGKMKGEALDKARSFAESKGMVAIPISMKEHPIGILGDWAAVEYQFKLVSPDSKDASGGIIEERADFIVKNDQDIIINSDYKENEDLYNDLMKLDNLRQQGILSEEEFTIEKQKVLDR